MLVLLIIFMVAAPLSTVDVPVDLPVASAKPQPRPNKPLYLTVKADLVIGVRQRRHSRRSFGEHPRRARPAPTARSAFSCAPTKPSPMAS